jgi:hypothetical protein|tara:strand:- start:524 stop:1453 length:930 start_codon:yes stop_codon:yes gene_type:complete
MSNTYEEEKPEVEVEEEGQEVFIETDPEPEAKAATEEAVEETVEEEKPKEQTQEEELESYSKGVQKRIKQLNDRYRNEQLQREEAVRMAEQLMEENKKLKTKVENLDSGFLNEQGARVESQLEAARRVFKEAYESGDADAITAGQEALARATAESDRYELAKKKADERVAVQQQPQQQQVAPQQAAPQQQAKPDPKAREWAEKNEWFGQDEVMTYATFGIHRKLIEEEGFDPNSDEYYSEIDRRLRSEFPNKFQATKKSGSNQVASAVSSASRNPKQGRKNSVKLSPSQIAIAKKLNVPLEEYAKYVKD